MAQENIISEEDIGGILVLGDVFFTKEDQNEFFDLVRNDLKNFIVLANLEGSIKFSNSKKKNKSVYLKLPQFSLEDIPNNLIFSMVNNHVTDFGIKNYFKNINFLKDRAYLSNHSNISNLINDKKFIFLADKKEQCILKGTGFLSFSNNQLKNISTELNSAIVIIHGGIEHRKYPSVYQRNLARSIIDKGAETVIFHHSHLIGHNELWKNKLIHYGLGNAFFSDVPGLHTLNKSVSNAVLIGKTTKILELDKLTLSKFLEDDRNNSINLMTNSEYSNFYKNKYKLDASFRPRQLSIKDYQINMQHFVWSFIANFLVKNNISSTVKSYLKIFFKDSK